MSKEKQIEKMAKIIGIPCYKRIEEYGDGSQECPSPLPCNECTAELLYNAGYRKQSGWISVEERLPGVSGRYICAVKDKNGHTWTVAGDYNLEMKKWFGLMFGEIKNTVTHWMPLPEPPKAKKPKAKQPKDSENYEKKRLLAGDCFHGEIWCRCPYCLTGIEAHSIPKDRICHNCGKEYL